MSAFDEWWKDNNTTTYLNKDRMRGAWNAGLRHAASVAINLYLATPTEYSCDAIDIARAIEKEMEEL